MSNVVPKTFGLERYEVINNLTVSQDANRALVLVSATRTSTFEKGQKRMVALSKLLKEKNIPFVWMCFSDQGISNAENIVFMKPTLNIAPYIKTADYLVQLSDQESFCYSIVEAMELGTPVITTPLDVLPELGFVDGKTGYVIPFDIDDKFDIEKIYKRQLKGKFSYRYDNEKRVKQWRKLLGEGKPAERTNPPKDLFVKVRAILTYNDIVLQKTITKGEVIEVKTSRAYDLLQKKFVELVID